MSTTDEQRSRGSFPLYVRLLPVASVVSLVLGLVCAVTGGFRWGQQGFVDGISLAYLAAAFALAALGALFHRWYRAWGE